MASGVLRVKRESPVDDVTTSVEVRDLYEGRVEISIEQSTFKHYGKRHAPTKYLYFLLDPEERARLSRLLAFPPI